MGIAEDEYYASGGVSTGTPYSRGLVAGKQARDTQAFSGNTRGYRPSTGGEGRTSSGGGQVSLANMSQFLPPVMQGMVVSYKGGKFLFKRHGKGIGEHSGGLVYEGRWSFGKWKGEGVLTRPGKWVYRGRFRNGMLHGKGRLMLENGMSFEGHFVRSMPKGKGTLRFRDGAVFAGKWTAGEVARGKYTEPDGSAISARINHCEITLKKGIFSKRYKVGEFHIRRILRGEIPA